MDLTGQADSHERVIDETAQVEFQKRSDSKLLVGCRCSRSISRNDSSILDVVIAEDAYICYLALHAPSEPSCVVRLTGVELHCIKMT